MGVWYNDFFNDFICDCVSFVIVVVYFVVGYVSFCGGVWNYMKFDDFV